MLNKSTWLTTFAVLLWANIVFSEEAFPVASHDKHLPTETSKWDQFLHFIRGEKPRDALFLGMWSYHLTKPLRYRTSHNLVALQYKSVYLGTFVNSHSDQTFVVGIARALYSTKFFREQIRFDLGYKIGPMYGYRERIPNIKGFSILPLLTGGITYKFIGIDINAVPGNALTMNFRLEKP